VTIFANVARIGGGEDLDKLGDHRAGQRAATDDRGQLPPHGIVAAEAGDHEHADDVGEGDGKNRGEPDQGGEGRFEVHLDGVAEARSGDGAVEEVADAGRDHHHDAHGEDPHQELHLNDGVVDRQQDEGDERHAGDAVGFETVGRGAHGVARVVGRWQSAIDAGIAHVVFLDLEDDLHQVGADVGDLGENAARHAQRPPRPAIRRWRTR